MSPWERFLLMQAQTGVNFVLTEYGSDVLSPEEQMVLSQAGALLTQLPMRLKKAQTPKTGA